MGAFATRKGLGEIATKRGMGVSATEIEGTIATEEVLAISHCVLMSRRGMSQEGLRRVPKKGGRELWFSRSARTCLA